MPRRFYAVATGNNHANLSTIFSLSERDKGDSVAWLETAVATKNSWARRSEQLLLNLRDVKSSFIEVSADAEFAPGMFGDLIAADFKDYCAKASDVTPVFALAGGPKLMALGFERATAKIAPTVPVSLYADLETAKLLRLDRPTDRFVPVSWGPRPISFEELLASRGLKFKGNPTQIWPRRQHTFRDLDLVRSSEEFRGLVFETYSFPEAEEWPGQDKARETLKDASFVTMVEGSQSLQDSWRKQVQTSVPAKCKARVMDPKGNLFQAAAGFFQNRAIEAVSAHRKRSFTEAEKESLLNDGWGKTEPSGSLSLFRLGSRFEDAVAGRVLKLLNDRPDLSESVREIWFRADVRRTDRESADAEYDVAILFENGRLLHLECKSGIAMDQKESDARLTTLRKTGGEGGEQVICGPLFQTPGGPAMDRLRKNKVTIEQQRLRFLPFDEGNEFERGLEQLMMKHKKAREAVQAAAH